MEQKMWFGVGLLLLNTVGFAIMLGGIIALQASCRGTNQPKVERRMLIENGFRAAFRAHSRLAICRNLVTVVSLTLP